MELPTKERIRDVALLLVKTVECPICLDILNDPLATSCHHRFCRVCIEKALSKKYKIPCPLCNAVVTKRSLNKSEKFAVIVEKVKKLSDAIKQDTGLDVTPQRGPRTTSVRSPEGRSLEIFNLLHPSPLKTRSSRVASLGSTKEALNRKRRATSASSTGDTAKPSKQIRPSEDLHLAGGSCQTAEDKLKQPLRSTSPIVTIEGDVTSEMNTAKCSLQSDANGRDARQRVARPDAVPRSSSLSSHSAHHVLMHREDDNDPDEVFSLKTQSEGPIPVRLCTTNKKDYTRRSVSVFTASISSAEKVSSWLQEHLDTTPGNAPDDPEQKTSENPATKRMTGRFFSLKPLGKVGSPGGRRKFLDVSDNDPYKFIPSQKTTKRPRKGGKKIRAKPKSVQRSNKLGRTSMISEEADLEFMKGQKGKGIVDPSELEVELFVTPATGLQQSEDSDEVFLPSKKKRSTKRISVSARRPKTLKDYMKLDVVEKEANKLQKMISEAQSFELNISKSPPRKEKRLQGKETGVALKDVSNLRADPAQNVPSSVPVSPLRRTALNLGPQESVVRERHNNSIGTPQESVRINSATEVQKNAKEQLKANSESAESVICLDEECLPMPECKTLQIQEDKEAGPIPSSNPIIKDNATFLPSHTEALENAVARCAVDMCTTFKKPCRKTFDVLAETEDLQLLAAAEVNTLDFMNDVCNDIEHLGAYSETDRYINAKERSSVGRVNVENLEEPPCPAEEKDQTDMNSNKTRNGTTTEENVDDFISKVTTEHRGIMTSQPPIESAKCCPNCEASLLISYTEGQISVTFLKPAQKPVLVDRGMCTEKPGTRVIICKEAVTQTEEQAITAEESWPVAKQSSAAPLPRSLECTSVLPMTGEQTPENLLCREHHDGNLQFCAADKTPPRGDLEACRMPLVLHGDPNSNNLLPQQNDKDICSSTGGVSEQHESRSAVKKNGHETCQNPNHIAQHCKDFGSQVQKGIFCCDVTDNTRSQNGYKTSRTPNDVVHCMDRSLLQDQQETPTPFHTDVTLMQEPDKTTLPSIPQAQKGMGAQCKDSAGVESDVVMSESDILCRETQDHVAGTRWLQEKRGKVDLVPIVEDTEESDCATSPSLNHVTEADDGCGNSQGDRVQTPASKDIGGKGCCGKTSFRESQQASRDAYNDTVVSDLPDVSECLNEHSKNENSLGGMASITQLSPQKIESSSCTVVEQRDAPEESRADHIKDVELPVDMGQETCHNGMDKERKKNETVFEISSPQSQAVADDSAKPVPHSAGTGRQTPENCSGAEKLQERSPNWSPPIALPKQRRSGRCLFGVSGWKKADSSEEASEDRVGKTKKSSGEKRSQRGKRKSSQGGKRKSGKFKKLVVDLEDSNEESPILVDPITESEANEILQRALANDEDSPDEAALNFARRAIAPFKCSNTTDPWTGSGSSRNLVSVARESSANEHHQTTSHQTGLSVASATKNISTRRSQSSRARVESFVCDEGSENVESRIAATTSTLSCLVDRTLKEKQLEHDIEEMKKQMQMLENELQQAAAMDEGTDDTVDIPSNFDDVMFDEESSERKNYKQTSAVSSLQGKGQMTTATMNKEDAADSKHLEDDFPDSDEELLLDLVPPTPPRRGVLQKELSFQRGKFH